MFFGTDETVTDDRRLSLSNTPAHSRTYRVISTPLSVDRRKTRLIQTSFFPHDISRGSTEADDLDETPYYCDEYSPACALAPLNAATMTGVQGMSTQSQLLSDCKRTPSPAVACVNTVSTQTLAHTEKAGEFVSNRIYSLTHVSFHPLVDIHNMSAQTLPLSEVLALSSHPSEGCLLSALDLSCDHHRMLRATQEDLETVRYYIILMC